MPPDDTTVQLLQAVLASQERTESKVQALADKVQDIAVGQARLEQATSGHFERQAERTLRRDGNCAESATDRAALWGEVNGLKLARAGDQGGKTSRAGVAQWATSLTALAFAGWTAWKG